MSKIFPEVPFRKISGFYYTKNIQYAFSEFAKSSYKWGRVVRLHCIPFKFCRMVWGTTWNLISHVYVFLITNPRVHHKNKSNSLESTLWKHISQFYGQTLTAKCKGLTLKIETKYLLRNWFSDYPTIFAFVNQPEGWWWQQHKHMTARATFYSKPETNFTGFNTAHLRLCPTYKMALWSPKRRIVLAWRNRRNCTIYFF